MEPSRKSHAIELSYVDQNCFNSLEMNIERINEANNEKEMAFNVEIIDLKVYLFIYLFIYSI